MNGSLVTTKDPANFCPEVINTYMRVNEILLGKSFKDRDLSSGKSQHLDLLKQRMKKFADAILDKKTSDAGKDFLLTQLRDVYNEYRKASPGIDQVVEAVNKLPLTHKDFELVKELMERPIPAVVAPIYIQEIIDDDELNAELKILEKTDPGRDVRFLIMEWIKRVMPDQMYRFTNQKDTLERKMGIFSPIHGYDPHQYKGTNPVIDGNAFGRR